MAHAENETPIFNMPIRIAYIIRGSYGEIGGAASYYFPLHAARTHEVLVFQPKDNGNELIVSENLGVRKKLFSNDNDFKDLKENLIKFKPQIVHVFQHKKYALEYFRKIKRCVPNSKWIIDFRSPLLTKNRSKRRKELSRYFLLQFYANRILSHSIKTIRVNIPLRFRKVYEIPPGVEEELFGWKPKEIIKPVCFVFSGSLSKKRKLKFLIRSFYDVAKIAPWPIHLDLFGSGDSEKDLLSFIKKNGYGKVIKINGILPHKVLLDRLQTYDCGISYVPNSAYETAPSLKMIEYAAAGIPILASSTKGQRDFSNRFNIKCQFFNNTSNNFSKALNSFLSTGATKQRSLQNIEATKLLTWHRIVNEILFPVYQSMIKDDGLQKLKMRLLS